MLRNDLDNEMRAVSAAAFAAGAYLHRVGGPQVPPVAASEPQADVNVAVRLVLNAIDDAADGQAVFTT